MPQTCKKDGGIFMKLTGTRIAVMGLTVVGLALATRAEAGHQRDGIGKGKHHEHLREAAGRLTEADILRDIDCGRYISGVSEIDPATGRARNLTLIDENSQTVESPAGASLCRIAMALNARGSRVYYVEPADSRPPVRNDWSQTRIDAGLGAPPQPGAFARSRARLQRAVETSPMYSADGTEIEVRGHWGALVEVDTFQPERILRRTWINDDLE